jgi:NADPH2 dehydrogenase
MSVLFSPLALRGVTLSNRIVISPMCQYSARNGEASDWHMMHLGHMAMSGAALLCLEATAVEADGRITPDDLGLWDDRTEKALKPVIDAVRRYSDIKIGVQLAHAGRKASCHVPWDGGLQASAAKGGWIPFAPSPVPFRDSDVTPHALDDAGLARVRNAFAQSAKRAARLGIDAIEIHGAHGYLLHQFLSPLSNRRTDSYGGSLENRMRFPLEVYDAVRAAFPSDRPVGMRVSATDWVDGGWDLPQTIAFAAELKKRGVDWIDASTAGLSTEQKITIGPGYQVPFAEGIRKETGVTTMAVGLITEAKQAEDILASGKADLIALARGILYDARWPWHAAAELGASVNAPPQYWRSQPSHLKTLFSDQRPAGMR